MGLAEPNTYTCLSAFFNVKPLTGYRTTSGVEHLRMTAQEYS